MAKFSPILIVAEDDHNSRIVNEKDLIFLALRPQIPRVHKLCWKDDKASRDWLKRISDMNSSLPAVNTKSTNYLNELQGCYHAPPKSFEEKPVNRSNKTDENFSLRGQISLGMQIPDRSQSRKPDSTYISTISRINVAIRFPGIPKRYSSDDNLTSPWFQPKDGKVPIKFLQENDLSPDSVFFTSEVNVQAKRKLSFEYIQEVSMLQYGQNSAVSGHFRR